MVHLINGLWQGALLTALVWILLTLIPRLNAATRYAVWWMTLAAVLILPFRPLLTRWTDAPPAPTAPPAQHEIAQADPPASASVIAPAPVLSLDQPNTIDSGSPQNVFPIRLAAAPVSIVIVLIWIALSSVLFVRLATSFLSLRGLKRRAAPAPAALEARFNHLRDAAGVSRQARLLVCDEVTAPMALGLFDPAILVPRSLPDRLSESDFDQVALHELAHLRRYDDWMNLLLKLAEALLPIQPALFWIGRQLALERETACDDWVIAATGTPKPYATALTRVAELTFWARSSPLASEAAGNPSQLYRRVHRLLDTNRNSAPRIIAMPLLVSVVAISLMASACADAPRMNAQADPAASSPAGTSAREATTAPSIDGPQSDTLLPQPGTQTRSFAAQANEKLRARIDRGDVHVQTWDKDQIQIIVTQKGRDIEEFLKHHRITITKEGHEVRIRAEADRSMPSSLSDIQIEYQITVPRKFDAGLAVSLGMIEVSDLQGPLNAEVSLGNVHVEKIAGPVTAEISQGTFDASDCSAALKASVSSGKIDLRHFTGPSCDAHASLGTISVDFASAPTADCSLEISSGNISVTVPTTAALNVNASTSLGTIRSDLAIAPSQSLTGGSLRGSVNGGGPTLEMTVSSGNIQISKH